MTHGLIDNPPAWTGNAAIGSGWGYFTGRIGDIAPHAHHAMQIVLSRTALKVWIDNAGWQECHGVVIERNVLHQLHDCGRPIKMVYLEPEDVRSRCIARRLPRGWLALDAAETEGLWHELEQFSALNPIQVLADVLCPIEVGCYTQGNDPVIQLLVKELAHSLPASITALELAQKVHLSPSRFQHRFVKYTGMPVRPYLRWRRLVNALMAIAQGASLTQAALSADFADAAHFSRTFRRHFGFAPKNLSHLHLRIAKTE
jgi:AraC-like DNA-binding protein